MLVAAASASWSVKSFPSETFAAKSATRALLALARKPLSRQRTAPEGGSALTHQAYTRINSPVLAGTAGGSVNATRFRRGGWLFCAIFLGVCMSRSAFAEETINYGVQPDTDPSFIAMALGYFKPLEKKYNAKVVFQRFAYGAPENQAMAAGALQIASAGMGPATIAVSRLSSTLVAINILEQTAILVPIDSTMKSPCDLKGKTVAFPGNGSQQYPLLLKALANCKLGVGDIKLFKSNGPDIPILVENKSVDAGITWDPSISVGLASGKVRLLAKAEQIMPIMGGHYVGNGVYVQNAFLEQHPDITQELVTANVKAINYILCHPDKAAKLWSEQIGIAENVIALSIKQGISVYSLDVVPTEKTMDAYSKFLKDAEILKPTDSPKINPSFATKALHEVQSGPDTCEATRAKK
jgi:ABC-type nitrate/sulfonate/bicarbonate transport system substrate-binding protein